MLSEADRSNSVDNTKVKVPKTGGAKRATEVLNKLRKQRPSEELVNIIAEYPIEPTVQDKPKIDRAARDAET